MNRSDSVPIGTATRRGRSALLLALVIGLLVSLLPLSSAAAQQQPGDRPVPEPTLNLPKQIDLIDAYEGQSLCDPTPKPGTLKLRESLWKTYGAALWAGISRDCNVTWDQGISEHKDGRAIDWGVHVRKASKADGNAFARWATANNGENARRMGIMYIIWDSAMWRLYDMDRGWAEYRSCKRTYTSSSYDTTCHRDHMHISMTWHGAGAWTSWYDGSAVTQRACRAGDPIDAKAGTPSSPSVLFDPLQGTGVRGGDSCYLGKSIQTLRLPVTKNRETTQRIRVEYVHSNAPSPVKIWTNGGSSISLSHTRNASEHNLQLGSDGLVYIQAPVGQAGIAIKGKGQSLLASAVASSEILKVPVAGGSTGVPSSAEAVSLNVTVTQPSKAGYLTVWPCGTGRPATSNVNFKAGQTVANAVVVGIGNSDRVCIFTSAEAHIVVDAAGYFPSGSPLTAIKPNRLLDTRTTPGKPAGGGDTAVRLPSGATAGALMITVTQPAGDGWVSAYPCGTTWPGTSTVNFAAGQTIAGSAIVKAGTNREVCIRTSVETHLVVDLMATLGNGDGFAASNPRRLADTRQQGAWLRPGAELQVAAKPSAPAVVVNLTGTGSASGGWIQAYPCGTKPAATSNVNYQAGQTISNAALVKTGGGKICVRSSSATHVVVDQNAAMSASTFTPAAPRRLADTRRG